MQSTVVFFTLVHMTEEEGSTIDPERFKTQEFKTASSHLSRGAGSMGNSPCNKYHFLFVWFFLCFFFLVVVFLICSMVLSDASDTYYMRGMRGKKNPSAELRGFQTHRNQSIETQDWHFT